jgi:hypothetical protein
MRNKLEYIKLSTLRAIEEYNQIPEHRKVVPSPCYGIQFGKSVFYGASWVDSEETTQHVGFFYKNDQLNFINEKKVISYRDVVKGLKKELDKIPPKE